MDEAIARRLVDLETRLAFQEQALQELSDALAEAGQEEARNPLRLHRALHELRQLRSVKKQLARKTLELEILKKAIRFSSDPARKSSRS